MLKGIFFAAFFGLAFPLFPIPLPSSLPCFLFSSPQPPYDTKRSGKMRWPKDLLRVSILGVWQVGDSRFKLMAYGSPFYSSIFTEKKILTSLFRTRLLCLFSFVFCGLRSELWNLKLVERLTIWQHEQEISHTKFSHGPFWRERPWEGVQWSNLLVVGINGCNAEHSKIRTHPDE